jgi:hypothetical protein
MSIFFAIRADSGTRSCVRSEGGRWRSPLCKEAAGASPLSVCRSVAEICHQRRVRNSHPASRFKPIASPGAAARCRGLRASVPTPPGVARTAKFARNNVRGNPALHNVFVRAAACNSPRMGHLIATGCRSARFLNQIGLGKAWMLAHKGSRRPPTGHCGGDVAMVAPIGRRQGVRSVCVP